MRQRWEDLPERIRQTWIAHAYARFLIAGHSYHPDHPTVSESKEQAGRWAWEKSQRTRLEVWSGGWYGMSWRDHLSMFRNNYVGHRNMSTYVNGPKFYIPPRRGPWLRFLRWLQVVPPKPLTIRDHVSIMEEKPWP